MMSFNSASELPTRQEQLKNEPKIPDSILPPTIAKHKSHNAIHNQYKSANVPASNSNNMVPKPS